MARLLHLGSTLSAAASVVLLTLAVLIGANSIAVADPTPNFSCVDDCGCANGGSGNTCSRDTTDKCYKCTCNANRTCE